MLEGHRMVWGEAGRQKRDSILGEGTGKSMCFPQNVFTGTKLLSLLNPNTSQEDSLGDPSIDKSFCDGVSMVHCAEPWRKLIRAV